MSNPQNANSTNLQSLGIPSSAKITDPTSSQANVIGLLKGLLEATQNGGGGGGTTGGATETTLLDVSSKIADILTSLNSFDTGDFEDMKASLADIQANLDVNNLDNGTIITKLQELYDSIDPRLANIMANTGQTAISTANTDINTSNIDLKLTTTNALLGISEVKKEIYTSEYNKRLYIQRLCTLSNSDILSLVVNDDDDITYSFRRVMWGRELNELWGQSYSLKYDNSQGINRNNISFGECGNFNNQINRTDDTNSEALNLNLLYFMLGNLKKANIDCRMGIISSGNSPIGTPSFYIDFKDTESWSLELNIASESQLSGYDETIAISYDSNANTANVFSNITSYPFYLEAIQPYNFTRIVSNNNGTIVDSFIDTENLSPVPPVNLYYKGFLDEKEAESYISNEKNRARLYPLRDGRGMMLSNDNSEPDWVDYLPKYLKVQVKDPSNSGGRLDVKIHMIGEDGNIYADNFSYYAGETLEIDADRMVGIKSIFIDNRLNDPQNITLTY